MSHVDFDPRDHTYRLDGKLVPSVTQVLAPLIDYSAVPQDILEAARDFGQAVHLACDLDRRGILDVHTLDAALLPYVEAEARFMRESGFVVIASEHRMISRAMRLAGTLDLAGMLRGSEVIIDRKVTADVPPTVGPQTAAYEELYRESRGGMRRKRYCLRLMPNKYQLVPLTDSSDYMIFRSALNLKHWTEKHGINKKAAAA